MTLGAVPPDDHVRMAKAALAATDAPPGPVASSEQGPLRLSAYPDLWVIDFDRAPQWLRRALIDAWQMSYAVADVILDGETLRHLAHCADERAARNQQKLSRLLTRDGTPDLGDSDLERLSAEGDDGPPDDVDAQADWAAEIERQVHDDEPVELVAR
jgi:hypothetical protein